MLVPPFRLPALPNVRTFLQQGAEHKELASSHR